MPQEEKSPGGGLSVATLVVSAVAAVIAAVVVSYVVPQGTLIATALTPVVVAIAKELLDRPAKTIAAVPKVVTTRVPAARDAPGATRRRREPRPEPEPAPREDPFGLYAPDRAGGTAWWRDRRVRLGAVTGIVAFLIGAAVVTASDLVTGSSVGGGGRTTLFSGGRSTAQERSEERAKERREREERDRDREATPTATPGAEDPRATPTAAPSGTPTPQATPTATPSATPPPAATPPPEATPIP